MKITYISHAALLIEVDGLKIITDPWLKGSAYCNQWFLFPKAYGIEQTFDADFVLYSHGHEDHLHPESLKLINKKAKIFYPYSWYDGTKPFFDEMGFKNVTEAINEKTYKIDKDTSITYFSNNLDNIVVIEHKNKVIVNVNDAFTSAPEAIRRGIISKIKMKWTDIDYVFSTYGGASYFPNCIKFSGKDDMEIGKTRELFFLNNFCDFVKELNPLFAIPFASDFVLLDDNQHWINEVKFPRNKIKEYYKTYTANSTLVEILEMYPGDYLDKGKFVKCSAYHQKVRPEGLMYLVKEEYAAEIEQRKHNIKLTDAQAKDVLDKLKKHVLEKLYIIPSEKRKEIKFALQLTDYSDSKYFNIDLKGATPAVYMTDVFEKDNILLMKLRSTTLLFSIGEEWGGDAIIIGYGCMVEIYDINTIKEDLSSLAVRLLTNYPNTKEYLKRAPFRAMKYLMTDSLKRNSLLSSVLPGKSEKIKFSDPRLGDHSLWLSKTKCEICKACNLPETMYS
jgi:hypothetical protein